jgi:hypothetical protein
MAKRHPNKRIQASVEYALDHEWRLVESQGHAWAVKVMRNHATTLLFNTDSKMERVSAWPIAMTC